MEPLPGLQDPRKTATSQVGASLESGVAGHGRIRVVHVMSGGSCHGGSAQLRQFRGISRTPAVQQQAILDPLLLQCCTPQGFDYKAILYFDVACQTRSQKAPTMMGTSVSSLWIWLSLPVMLDCRSTQVAVL
jgi:hypothetical protein